MREYLDWTNVALTPGWSGGHLPKRDTNGQDSDQATRGVPLRVSAVWLDRVRRAMQARAWSQQRLADEAGVSQSAVSRLFTGGASTLVVSRIAHALGVADPAEQLHDEELQDMIYLITRLRALAPLQFETMRAHLRAHVDAADALERVTATVAHHLQAADAAPKSHGEAQQLPAQKPLPPRK